MSQEDRTGESLIFCLNDTANHSCLTSVGSLFQACNWVVVITSILLRLDVGFSINIAQSSAL